MTNILVTGSNGQLGSEIKNISANYSAYNFNFVDISQLDITKHQDVEKYVKKNNIDLIINCAAYTAVDKAESEPYFANEINHNAVANLAKICKNYNIKLIHISTDYIFDGNQIQPYKESDTPNPQSVYGQTKLDGEIAMKRINPANSIIIRTAWVYSRFGNNFVKTMLSLAKTKEYIDVVNDQIGSPTNACDLACAILNISKKIKNKNVEIYHYSNEGECSWFEFAKAIFDILEIPMKINPVSSKNFITQAIRPSYSKLCKNKFKTVFKVKINPWKISLEHLLSSNNFIK